MDFFKHTSIIKIPKYNKNTPFYEINFALYPTDTWDTVPCLIILMCDLQFDNSLF